MASRDEVGEIESLERGLLSDNGIREDADRDETVLYAATFEAAEEKFVKYQTAQWVLYSLPLILAWGIGLFMLLYLPVRRYILRKDIRSRKLYLTPNAIVYKVTRPVPFPCFGMLKKEKYVLLPLVADIVIEQDGFGNLSRVFAEILEICIVPGYLQSFFGVYSLRIENAGVRRPTSDDVKILGIADPRAFRKAVLTHLSKMRNEVLSRQTSTVENFPNLRIGHPSPTLVSPSKSLRHNSISGSGDLIIQKLEDVGSSVKRVEALIEEQHPQASEPVD